MWTKEASAVAPAHGLDLTGASVCPVCASLDLVEDPDTLKSVHPLSLENGRTPDISEYPPVAFSGHDVGVVSYIPYAVMADMLTPTEVACLSRLHFAASYSRQEKGRSVKVSDAVGVFSRDLQSVMDSVSKVLPAPDAAPPPVGHISRDY
jgi:hypothetical protein